MKRDRAEEASTKDGGRVSPYAPDIASPSFQAWDLALKDLGTQKALDEGMADLAGGRTKPWEEIRRRMK